MTGRGWRPGDVAMVTVALGSREGRTEKAWLNSDGCWVFADGEAFHSSRADLIKSARPLVLIDPEDREQAERLEFLYLRDSHNECDDTTGCMQAALREFASPTPAKPDEPTGLGAVVEDEKGRLHLLAHPGEDAAWMQIGIGSLGRWRDIDVAKVLDDGYKAGEPS